MRVAIMRRIAISVKRKYPIGRIKLLYEFRKCGGRSKSRMFNNLQIRASIAHPTTGCGDTTGRVIPRTPPLARRSRRTLAVHPRTGVNRGGRGVAGYENLNDTERLAADPTFRLINSQIGEGNVSEKRVREVQSCALGFSRSRRKGSSLKNLAGAWHAGG